MGIKSIRRLPPLPASFTFTRTCMSHFGMFALALIVWEGGVIALARTGRSASRAFCFTFVGRIDAIDAASLTMSAGSSSIASQLASSAESACNSSSGRIRIC